MTSIIWEIDEDGSHNTYNLPCAQDNDEYGFGAYVERCPSCGDFNAVIMMHAYWAEMADALVEETFDTIEEAKQWVEHWEPSAEQYQQAEEYAAFMEIVDELVDE